LQLDHQLQSADGYHAAFEMVPDRLDDGVIPAYAASRPLFLNTRTKRIVTDAAFRLKRNPLIR